MKFTEAKLEQAFTELLTQERYPHYLGDAIKRYSEEVFIEKDLRNYLPSQYASVVITNNEVESIIRNCNEISTLGTTKRINKQLKEMVKLISPVLMR